MQKSHTGLAIGEAVVVRGGVWRVADARRFGACERLDLVGLGADAGRTCAVLHPFDRPARAVSAAPRVVPVAAVADAFATAVRTAHPWGALARAAEAAIDLLPYQLEPALAALRGRVTRVLIADEVGLGKTIQAGLVLAELRARGRARRALVLAPAGLRDQWAGELDRRFGLAPRVVDAWRLARSAGAMPGVNPWALDGVSIVSIDFIKRPEVVRALERLAWDLVIVDEAHAVAGATDRYVAVNGLCRRARVVVLLTATPHAGMDDSFARLCGLGQLGAADRLAVFRRTRAALGVQRPRRVRMLRVRLSAPERRMHRLLERYTREVWRGSGERSDVRLAMIVLRKRALSCAASLFASIDRRRRLLDPNEPTRPTQLDLPLDADLTLEDEPPAGVLAAPGLTDVAREQSWLSAIASAAARAGRVERKMAALARLLRRGREPAIVFTEYRDTLEVVADRLARVAPIVTLHGAMTRHERGASVAAFEAGRARVLVATDAAGQGLNLQGRCRWVVNFELPWTHARIEQRIGRVDRLGQSRAVHALHLVARDTAEALVATRLVCGERRTRAALGRAASPAPFPEGAMAALVMDGGQEPASRRDGLRPCPRHPPPRVSVAGAAAEAARLEGLRALGRLTRRRVRQSSAAEGVLMAALGRRRSLPSSNGGTPGVVLVYRVAIADGAGRPVDVAIVPALVEVDLGPPRRGKAALGDWLRVVVDGAVARGAARAARHADGRLRGVRRRQQVACRIAETRERALSRALADPLASPLVQAGLFDRRAIRAADRARREAEARSEDTAARLRDVEAGRRLSTPAPELLIALLWPGGRSSGEETEATGARP